jgi:hypothetical protein
MTSLSCSSASASMIAELLSAGTLGVLLLGCDGYAGLLDFGAA